VPPEQTTPEADQRPVMPGYFEAMGIDLVRGRFFNEGDAEGAAPVAIVDETMEATYWPGEGALGKRIRQGGGRSTQPWRTIVGVVRHVRYRTVESPSRVELYWPYEQTPFLLGSLSLAIRTHGDPRLLARSVEAQVRELDPDLPVYRLRTMNEWVAESMARRRLSMILLALFSAAALLLAAVGLYGVISCSVAQRRHEMGLRMALGAGTGSLLWMVLRESLLLTAAGVAAGLAGALLLARFLPSLLFQVEASDPLTFVLVAAFLAVVAQLASLVPAVQAARTDPIETLRTE
jgi:putative ABC transport system permease protein